MPGSAPSTPACHEPAVLTGFPFSNSVVSSPKYQTLPCAVLGVPVEGVLDELALAVGAVSHHGRRDAHDRLRVSGHLDDDVLAFAVEDGRGAGDERPIRVIDDRHEVGRVDGHVVWRAFHVGCWVPLGRGAVGAAVGARWCRDAGLGVGTMEGASRARRSRRRRGRRAGAGRGQEQRTPATPTVPVRRRSMAVTSAGNRRRGRL